MKKIICAVIFLCLISVTVMAGTQHDNVTYYFLTDEVVTFGWDDDQTNVVYDMALKRFEWDEIVFREYDITELQHQISFPKTGMYIPMVRTRRELTTSESDSLDNMTKSELITQATIWNIVDDIEFINSLTEEELRTEMRNFGFASIWATSISDGSVDGAPRSWWVYCYIAPPGPPVIGERDGHPAGITIISGDKSKDSQIGP